MGRAEIMMSNPMREMPVCVEILFEPENSNNCVNTAPNVPPLPVMPEITPRDLIFSQFTKIKCSFFHFIVLKLILYIYICVVQLYTYIAWYDDVHG